MTHWEFPATGPIDLDISLLSGQITIAAEATEVVTVSLAGSGPGSGDDGHTAGVQVDFTADRLEIIESGKRGIQIRSSGSDLAVTVPVGSRCTVRAFASSVTCQGELGSLDVRTASGDVTATVVRGPVQVTTISGAIELDEALADVAAQSASGDIRLHRAGGEVDAHTTSGDIHIGTAATSVTARTASGSVRVDSVATGNADLSCVSGDVTVAVVPGADVYLDLASVIGRVSSDLEPSGQGSQADLRIKCRSVNGDVRVTRIVLADAN